MLIHALADGFGREREKGARGALGHVFLSERVRIEPSARLFLCFLLAVAHYTDRPCERLQENTMDRDPQMRRLSSKQRDILKRMRARMSDPVKTEKPDKSTG